MKLIGLTMIGMTLVTGHAAAGDSAAPSAGIARKNLLTATLAAGMEISKVEIKQVTLAPNIKAPLHLHPCPVVGTVTEGAIAFQIEGEPVQYLKTGDAFYEPALTHIARFDNDGESAAQFTAFYMVCDGSQELVRILAQ